MKALIFNNTVCQIVNDHEVFEVHEELFWVDCPPEATTEWVYKNGSLSKPEEAILSYDVHRRFQYPDISEQLDILYHEGYDGWKAAIKAVKDKFPKPE
jgi:hypothetical protein